MNVTIRKAVPQKVKDSVMDSLEKVLVWMQGKYPSVDFTTTDFIFSNTYSRSRYFRNAENAKYTKPVTCVSTRSALILYNLKSLRLKKAMLSVDNIIQIESSLVHELTHHAQYETGSRVGSEVETTQNELEYLRTFYPEIYQEFK